MHVVRGLRQALLMLILGGVTACASGAIWYAARDGDVRTKVGISLLVIAGLLSVTGGTLLSRLSTNEARAFFGAGPDREEAYTGEGLGSVGVFLFVALPLFVAGLALLG